MSDNTQIKVKVTKVFETELKKYAALEHRSLSNFCESILIEEIRRRKWGDATSRDGRSCDEPHIGGTD